MTKILYGGKEERGHNRETYADGKCSSVGQVAAEALPVLDELAAAAMEEIELMWSCFMDDDRQRNTNHGDRRQPNEVTVYKRSSRYEKQEFPSVVLSFSSSDVSMDGLRTEEHEEGSRMKQDKDYSEASGDV